MLFMDYRNIKLREKYFDTGSLLKIFYSILYLEFFFLFKMMQRFRETKQPSYANLRSLNSN